MNEINVRPVDNGGWLVELAGVQDPQHFSSGARAESAAKRLAETLADAGRLSEIFIYLRDGTLGGRFVATGR